MASHDGGDFIVATIRALNTNVNIPLKRGDVSFLAGSMELTDPLSEYVSSFLFRIIWIFLYNIRNYIYATDVRVFIPSAQV